MKRRRPSICCLFSVSVCFFAKAAHAEEVEPLRPSWWDRRPPDLEDQKLDWIRFSANEWINGELLELRDNVYQFDSDYFGEKSIDAEDVAGAWLGTSHIVLFEDGQVWIGTGWIDEQTVHIDGSGERPRSGLLSILRSTKSEIQRWALEASVGINAQFGNTDQQGLTVTTLLKRTGNRSRLEFDFLSTVARADGELTANRQRLATSIDYLLTREIFLIPFTGTFSIDEFQNILFRAQPGSGLGWHIVDHRDFSLDVQAGLAYQFTRFDSVPVGDNRDDQNFGFFGALVVEWDITNDIELDTRHETFGAVIDPGQSTLLNRATLSIDLISVFDLDTSVIHNRVFDPPANVDGSVPAKDDVTLTIGLSLSLGD